MNTVPATGASNASVPPQVHSASAQASPTGTPSLFQVLYQNLPAMHAQTQGDAKPSLLPKIVLPKKQLPDEKVTNTLAAAATALNNVVAVDPQTTPAPAIHAPVQAGAPSEAAPAAPPQSDHVTPTPVAVVAPGSPQIVPGTDRQAATSTPLLSDETPKTTEPAPPPDAKPQHLASAAPVPALPAVHASAPISVAPPAHANTQVANRISPAPTSPTNNASANPPDSGAPPQPQRSAQSAPGIPSLDASTASASSFVLSAGNLAFSMELSQRALQSTSDLHPSIAESAAQLAPPSTSPAPSTTAAPATKPVTEPAPLLAVATPRSLPSIQVPPSVQHSSNSEPAAREPRDLARTDPASANSSHAAKIETTARGPVAAGPQTPPSAATADALPNTFRPASPNSSAWLSNTAQVDTRPSPSLFAQPAPVRPTNVAVIHEVQPLAAEAPRPNAGNEILLHLDNGQSSAAIRVVDRAGTVNVAVHSPDQDLRTSLRSNLNDLTSQLSAQGVKTDALKTVAAQPASENRQQTGGQGQRSPNQQQSTPQNDRQPQRDRRPNPNWLAELQQTSDASNSTGKNA